MKNTAFVSIFFTMVAVVAAHVCMLSPPQRGSMLNINKPASPDCALLSAPCGGRNSSMGSTIAIKEGSRFVVSFQKNLDHFYKSNPGSFKISVSFDKEKTFQLLQYLPDTVDPSLTLYYVNVTMPTGPLNKPGTLRVTYVTQNPQAPADSVHHPITD